RFYVDGALAERCPRTPQGESAIAAEHAWIGAGKRKALLPSFWHFAGLIDEVRVSKKARYDKDFKPARRFEPDADTLALYHFDEGQGDVLIDSSGNAHHGKIVGAKWVKTALPIGDVKPDAERIEGQWQLIFGEHEGKPLPLDKFPKVELRFSDGEFEM